MLSLDGKRILITGASRGIGAALAKLCSQAGGRPILHARAPSPAAETLAKSLATDFIYEDLSQPEAGTRLVEAALTAHGHVNGVVNNAGQYLATPLSDGDAWRQGWAQTLATNLQAPADICKAAIAHFRVRQSGGIVVNIASRAGQRGDGPDHAAYAASKGGILALTKTYARALSGEGILFYAIAPGWVETRMAPEDIRKRAEAVKDIPLARVAQPDEVAQMALFLLSGACPSAVGTTIDINGASYVR